MYSNNFRNLLDLVTWSTMMPSTETHEDATKNQEKSRGLK